MVRHDAAYSCAVFLYTYSTTQVAVQHCIEDVAYRDWQRTSPQPPEGSTSVLETTRPARWQVSLPLPWLLVLVASLVSLALLLVLTFSFCSRRRAMETPPSRALVEHSPDSLVSVVRVERPTQTLEPSYYRSTLSGSWTDIG